MKDQTPGTPGPLSSKGRSRPGGLWTEENTHRLLQAAFPAREADGDALLRVEARLVETAESMRYTSGWTRSFPIRRAGRMAVAYCAILVSAASLGALLRSPLPQNVAQSDVIGSVQASSIQPSTVKPAVDYAPIAGYPTLSEAGAQPGARLQVGYPGVSSPYPGASSPYPGHPDSGHPVAVSASVVPASVVPASVVPASVVPASVVPASVIRVSGMSDGAGTDGRTQR